MTSPKFFQPNSIYCGDCKEVLTKFPDACMDLVYADPPFFSNQTYEVSREDEYGTRGFEDRWSGGIQTYLSWMVERIKQIYRVLKDSGLFYLHCGIHASHYLKVESDKIFGYDNFRNEIIWCYSGGGIPKKDFPNKHDIIFRYSKTKDYIYNPEYKPYTTGTVKRGRTQVKGKYFEEGLRTEGTPITDWWTDIKCIHSPTDKERLGYPTQKSEALLERIINTSSISNDIVLDPFSGSGTTIAVAHRLGRRWVGIEISPVACKLMNDRMRKLDANPFLVGIPMDNVRG